MTGSRTRVTAALLVWLAFGSVSARAAADDTGVPLPAGSRAREHQVYESSRGFHPTVRFYRQHFDKRGPTYQLPAIYAYRGVSVARFLSRDPASPWLAVHIFQHQGRTFIHVVPRERKPAQQPLDPAATPR